MSQYFKIYTPYLLCFILLYSCTSFHLFFLSNLILQFSLFLLIAGIPAYLTKRMSYVDIAWPLGLVGIGVINMISAEEFSTRILCISSTYLIMGSRMVFGALVMWKKGAFKVEFPRYDYQRIVWKKKGYSNLMLTMQSEIFLQAAANCTFLSIPAFIQSVNPRAELSYLEIFGYGFWVVAIIFESIADVQKRRFIKSSANKRGEVCNVGLWKYSRHPNYFGEWMVWNCLVVSSLPSLFYFCQNGSIFTSLVYIASLLFIPKLMYQCLVYYTGAHPSEYYSKLKRPRYKHYMQSTNQFFPWKPSCSKD